MYELAVPSLLGKDAVSLEEAARANIAAYAALCGGACPLPQAKPCSRRLPASSTPRRNDMDKETYAAV